MPTKDKLLTVEEVAQRLSVNEHTVYRLIRASRMSFIRFGQQYRIGEMYLENWIRDHTVPEKRRTPRDGEGKDSERAA